MFSLNPMASVAQSHMCGHIPLHTVPPVPLLEIVAHLGTAWMDRVSKIVSFSQDSLSEVSLFILYEIWGFSLFHTLLDFLYPNII
jgi:hypothetical protein